VLAELANPKPNVNSWTFIEVRVYLGNISNCTHMPLHHATNEQRIKKNRNWRQNQAQIPGRVRTKFSIKIQIDANKWPSPIPSPQSSLSSPLSYSCSCSYRTFRDQTKSRFRPHIKQIEICLTMQTPPR